MNHVVIRALALLFLLSAAPVQAQNGGLFLLVPFGARAVGQGEAVAADTALGTEALWWNAAGSARGGRREVGIHHSQTVLATSDMVAFMMSSKVLGTVTGAFYMVNYGDLPVTPPGGGEVILGNITNRNYLAALSYASTIGDHLSAGITYKFAMLRFECTGVCGDIPVISGSTSALDLGAQYRIPGKIPAVIGATVRNIGPALQVKDREQADPLPRILQIGARAGVPFEALNSTGATLEIMADYKRADELGNGSFGAGAVLGYRDEFFLRGGYVRQPGQGGGPSLGVGASRGAFTIDIARRFDQLSPQLGDSPTYVSLRIRF